MLLVRRTGLAVVLLLTLASVLFLGIRGYSVTGKAALSETERKLHAENLLYLTLISSILLAFCYGVLFARSRSIIKEIDKIIELTRVGNISIQESLKKIGIIGRKIRTLYENLNDLNEKKSLKISSLSGLIAFLLGNVDLSLLVTDATGKVTDVSQRFKERSEDDGGSAVGKNINDILPELPFEEIATALERQHNLIQRQIREPFSFYPIFNRAGDMSHVVCIIGRQRIYTGQPSEEAAKPVRKGLASFIKRFSQRRKP